MLMEPRIFKMKNTALRRFLTLALLLVIVKSVLCENRTDPEAHSRSFPKGFRFGVSTSAHQIEGAWNVDGKSMSIWDHLSRSHPEILNDGNGGVSADSYNKYEKDVQMLRELGVDDYKFSVSWTRILPDGFANNINALGVLYYQNLIDELLKYNITPIITMYHWDLPQRLQNFGGWTNPLIIEWFADYAKVLFSLFGDKVKTWITINQPQTVCLIGYGLALGAPFINETGIADYLCSKNTLLAHARAYHIYDEEFRETQGGRIGIANLFTWAEPATNSSEDIQAAEDFKEFDFGQYVHPIFSETGDYPIAVRERILRRSLEQAYPRSRLQTLDDEEIAYIKGTSDFLIVNHYTAVFAYRNQSLVNQTFRIPSYHHDMYVGSFQGETWPKTHSSLQRSVPWALYKLLLYIKEHYNNINVYIGENGISTDRGLDDDDRVNFLRSNLKAVLDAIDAGCKVVGYNHWSLMDNYNWMHGGYQDHFGLYEVDFESSEKTRTARKSAFVYKDIIKERKINLDYDPDPTADSIEVEKVYIHQSKVESNSSAALTRCSAFLIIISYILNIF